MTTDLNRFIESIAIAGPAPEKLDPAAQAIYRYLSESATYLKVDFDTLLIPFNQWTSGMNLPSELMAEHMRAMVLEGKLLPWHYPVMVNGQKSLPDKHGILKLNMGDGVVVGRLANVTVAEAGLYQIDTVTGHLTKFHNFN